MDGRRDPRNSALLQKFSVKKCPGMYECREAINKSKANNGVLHRRKWDTILKKVSYLMHRK